VVCSNKDSILHHFSDTTTFAMYVTACDLQKTIFKKAVEVTSHIALLTQV